jgi:hypothetical protein
MQPFYINVSNAHLLKKRIINASTAQGTEGDQEREAVSFAFIDARLVSLHLTPSSHSKLMGNADNEPHAPPDCHLSSHLS